MSVRKQFKQTIPKNSIIHQILARTNDFTIYSYFLGQELTFSEVIRSPLRTDKDPTFNIFPAKLPRWENQILFKDFNGETGNVFKFVEKYVFYKHGIHLKDIHETIEYIVQVMGLDGVSAVQKIEKVILQ
jgi:hypothetical protein